jgi:hypothetical protein
MRYAKSDVKNLSLKLMGSLFSEAGYDSHVYKFGLIKKRRVRRP